MGIKVTCCEEKFEKFLQSVDNKECEHFKLARKFMNQRNYRQAIKEYLMSMIFSKPDITLYKEISKAYKKIKCYDKAINHLVKAKTMSRFDSEIYYELGLNHLLNANSQEARKNFIRTIKLNPTNINAQIQLAISHELLGEEDMALSIYQKIIEENPSYIPAYNHKAGLCITLEMYIEASHLFYQILNINPAYYRANLGLGICFDKMNKFSRAIRYYKKYIARKPHSDTTKSLVGRICEIYNTKHSKSDKLRIIK